MAGLSDLLPAVQVVIADMAVRNMPGAQILVIDDNESHTKLVSFLLSEAGYAVKVAPSAELAIDLLKSFKPQLILVDLQLPGMDGLELTRRLRFDPTFNRTLMVAMTAYTDPAELEKARQAGCDGHITKPLDPSTFVDLVREFAKGIHPDVLTDARDLLAEVRNSFLTEGLEHCGAILNDLESRPRHAMEVMRRVSHRWAGVGGTLGYVRIYHAASRVEKLLTAPHPRVAELKEAIKAAQHLFHIEMHFKPKLPVVVIAGLKGVRMALLGFPAEESNRIRSSLERSQIEATVNSLEEGRMEEQTNYDLMIVNGCAPSSEAWLRSKLAVPLVFIGSRSSLDLISTLPARVFDFLIAPWDAEEVLMRAFRILGRRAIATPKPDVPSAYARRKRVLIADDDPDITTLVSEVLSQFEVECETASSGRQALDLIRRRLPDAVILDVNMLDLDGFEVLRRIRRNLLTRHLPVLLLTGRNHAADVARGFGDGANDYMIKPFQPLELANRVAPSSRLPPASIAQRSAPSKVSKTERQQTWSSTRTGTLMPAV